jgi:hypothetical protein
MHIMSRFSLSHNCNTERKKKIWIFSHIEEILDYVIEQWESERRIQSIFHYEISSLSFVRILFESCAQELPDPNIFCFTLSFTLLRYELLMRIGMWVDWVNGDDWDSNIHASSNKTFNKIKMASIRYFFYEIEWEGENLKMYFYSIINAV